MNRRDFLTLSTDGRKRIVELSCEHLYMRYVDARSALGRSQPTANQPTWEGEPPMQIETPTTTELFEALEQE